MHKKSLLGIISISILGLTGCVSAPVVAAGASGTVAANSAGSSVMVPQQVDDLTIRSNIYTVLNNLQGLNGANVEVTVFNGIVLLLGQVPDNDLMQQIVTRVSAINGVVVVYNQMVIGANEPISQFTSDSWITSKVIAKISEKVNPLHFKVVTQSGVVYLLGQVTHNEANLAVAQASQVEGVKSIVKIFNYIQPSLAQPVVVPVAQSPAAAPTASTTNATATPAVASSTVNNPSPVPTTPPASVAPTANDNGSAVLNSNGDSTQPGSAASD
jgi:osmotically-inducible protein OsmY